MYQKERLAFSLRLILYPRHGRWISRIKRDRLPKPMAQAAGPFQSIRLGITVYAILTKRSAVHDQTAPRGQRRPVTGTRHVEPSVVRVVACPRPSQITDAKALGFTHQMRRVNGASQIVTAVIVIVTKLAD